MTSDRFVTTTVHSSGPTSSIQTGSSSAKPESVSATHSEAFESSSRSWSSRAPSMSEQRSMTCSARTCNRPSKVTGWAWNSLFQRSAFAGLISSSKDTASSPRDVMILRRALSNRAPAGSGMASMTTSPSEAPSNRAEIS